MSRQGTIRTKLSTGINQYVALPSAEGRLLTIIRDLVAIDGEVDTGLKNSVLAGIAVNANPSSGSLRAARAGCRLGSRDDERSSHRLVGTLESMMVSKKN